ncbi:MAG: hypothetical protein V4520_02515 [Bacteroidota bacterium]
MILEATLTLTIDGNLKRIVCNVYDKTYPIRVNGYAVGRMMCADGKWVCGATELNPYAESIINSYAAVRKKFKWNLPERLRNAILWGKYNIDTKDFECAIVDSVTFEWFEAELKAALAANNIQPDLLLRLYQPRIITYYNDGIKL